jgi:DNA-binding transcriptional regulator YhcF (GntR family)
MKKSKETVVADVATTLKEKYEKGELKPNFSRKDLAKELKVNVWNVSDATAKLKKEGINIRKTFREKKNKLHPTLEEGIEISTLGKISVYKITGSPKVVAQLLKEMEG